LILFQDLAELPQESTNVEDINKNKDKTEEKEEKEEESESKHKSVLQAKLTKVTIQISYFGIAAALFTFLVLCFRMAIDQFVTVKNTWSNDYFKYIIQYLIQGITVLVVTVPEGLPLAVALALAFAVKVSENLERIF
jgi:Ca2+ transporting ATPase